MKGHTSVITSFWQYLYSWPVQLLLGGSVVAGGIIFGLLLFARSVPDHPYYADGPEVTVIAHRGGKHLWPENTHLAFQKAAAMGVDALEMDVHISADGVLVVLHDDTVDRTTNGRGRVATMTLAELQKLDAGYHWSPDGGTTFPYRGQGLTIPTLEDVFRALPELRMVVEIKPSDRAAARLLCELIGQYRMQARVLVASFQEAPLRAFRAHCSEVATSAARLETTRFVLLSKIFLSRTLSPGFQSLQVPPSSSGITIMTPRFVRAAHARNLKVECWTINDPARMQQYINWGVDGIVTDRPDLLLQLLGRGV